MPSSSTPSRTITPSCANTAATASAATFTRSRRSCITASPAPVSCSRRAWRRGSSNIVFRALGQYLEAVVGDQNGVFPLRGEAVILGDHGPDVGQELPLALAGIHHGLDGAGHAG